MSADRDGPILTHLAKGVCVTLLVLVFNISLEHAWWIERMRYVAYQSLQQRLVPPDDLADEVVVIDISMAEELERTDVPDAGDRRRLTSRSALATLVTSLAAQGPRAIAIDIDFSTVNGAFRSRRDPGFFGLALETWQRDGIPIILGVYAGRLQPPDNWLGPDFVELAAGMSVPVGDVRHALWRQRRADHPTQPLANLGPRVATVLGWREHRGVPTFLQWAAVSHSTRVDPLSTGVFIDLFPVDYSPLRRLRIESLVEPAQKVPSIKDKVVFVGDFGGPDQHPDPTGGEASVMPGTKLHALAFLTLFYRPLLELTHAGRIALDLLLVSSGLLLVAAVRAGYRVRRQRIASHRLERAWAALVAILIVLASAWFVEAHRILWDDYLLCALVVLAHPFLEEKFWPMTSGLTRQIRGMWHRMVQPSPLPAAEESEHER